MRLSVRVDDPGYITYGCIGHLGPHIRILLNGQEVKAVITADEEDGTIVRVKRDAEGNLLAEHDSAIEETLRGKVEIILPPAYRN